MYNNNQLPLVTVLYTKEFGPGRDEEIKLLKTLPWVKNVIAADYRFKVGSDAENLAYINMLRQQWNSNISVPFDSMCYSDHRNLDELIAHYIPQADCIFVAGSSFDPSQEYCFGTPKRITPDKRREQFELKLIKAAKERGIPLLAICAGSWRLTNAYGVKTIPVAEHTVTRHEQWEPVRDPDRKTYIAPNTMLRGIHVTAQNNREIIFSEGKAQKKLLARNGSSTTFDPKFLHVNSTHWRVSPYPEVCHNTEFNKTFETAAIDIEHGTLEGYESKRGAPIMALQWHPEYTIPYVKKKDGTWAVVEDYKTHRHVLDSLVESGLTFSRKRMMHKELKLLPDAERIAVRSRI